MQYLLWIAIAWSIIFGMLEVWGAKKSGSLSLMGDAIHLASDAASYISVLVGMFIGRRPANEQMTFGFKRAETLSTLLSLMLIWSLSARLVESALHRLVSPQPVSSWTMLIVAMIGLVGNVG